MQATINGIRMNYRVTPGISHMLCAEDPPAFHGHVLGFLDKVAR